MDKCFLIGNGLNRTLKASISWDELLKDIAEEHNVEYCADIPMPLEFERIVNCCLCNSVAPSVNVYSEFKKEIAKKILYTKLPQDGIHYRLLNSNANAIMTTNYDYLLEYVFSPSYEHKGKQQKYLFDPTSIQKGVQFYHLHGMAAVPQSICLGYEHYAGIVEKLRTQLNKKENNENQKMIIKQVLLGEKEPTNTWGERFYTSNIAIMGLGLSSCEIDLWWLITHRAYLYFADYCGLKSHIKNLIVYYDIVDDIARNNSKDEDFRRRRQNEKGKTHLLLRNSHVDVKTYNLSEFDGSYFEAYSGIIDDAMKLI